MTRGWRLARNLGATETFNSKKADVVAEIQKRTSGRGADVALECVGITDAIGLAVESVRKGGAVTLVGNVAPKIELALQSVVSRQIRLQGLVRVVRRVSGVHCDDGEREDSRRAAGFRSGAA